MIFSRLKLRQKLLILLFCVGGIGLSGYILVLTIADYQLSEKFIPENRALHDVESRSALLIQNYFRFMLTPDIIDIDVLDGELVLIRKSLDTYRQVIAGQSQKEQLATNIGNSIDGLERAGSEMIVSRQEFAQIFTQQEQLEIDIDRVFGQYKAEVSVDIGTSINNQDWSGLTRNFFPELRMIEGVKTQFLRLFLEIREFQIDPSLRVIEKITALQQRLKSSSTMFEIYVANSAVRADLSEQILAIYKRMLGVVDALTMARQHAEFALSRAEQSGIDLNESMQEALSASDSVGWNDLRESLILSGSILFFTLVVGYLLIYFGLDRILRPLEKLQVVISRLGQGDFKQRSKNIGRGDEIGLLATAFNQMADQLEENEKQKQEFIVQLEQKNMELERFTYTVSHELKAPMVTISGFMGLLDRDLGDDKSDVVERDMQKIASAIETMNMQLEDLLELSRIGRVVNPPQVFELTDVCHEVLESLHGSISEAAAQVEIEDKMPRVYADQARVREVMQNLIENAIKFSQPQGQPHVDISAKIRADKVLCSVRDNGPGIDPEYHEKVFELFDRLDSNVAGTGIGLALAKRIIEIHGGEIWIEPNANVSGACFVFELPAAATASQPLN